ncbi:MAG: hypothetical protein ABJ205_07655 [Erythrobacter sp.]
MKNLNTQEIETVGGAFGAVLVIIGPIGPLIAAGEAGKEAAED